MLNIIDRLRYPPIIPYFGSGEAFGNFVPVDYIIEATYYLTHSKIGRGKTYHLTAPNPYQMKMVYQMLMKEYLNKIPNGILPLSLANQSLSLSFIRKGRGRLFCSNRSKV